MRYRLGLGLELCFVLRLGLGLELRSRLHLWELMHLLRLLYLLEMVRRGGWGVVCCRHRVCRGGASLLFRMACLVYILQGLGAIELGGLGPLSSLEIKMISLLKRNTEIVTCVSSAIEQESQDVEMNKNTPYGCKTELWNNGSQMKMFAMGSLISRAG